MTDNQVKNFEKLLDETLPVLRRLEKESPNVKNESLNRTPKPNR